MSTSLCQCRYRSVMMMVMMTASLLAMAKNQRLDHNRDSLCIGQFLTDIDEIEIFEVDAVDRNDACSGYELAFDDVSHQFSDVRVKDQHHWLSLVNVLLHGADKSFRQSANERIGRTKLPSNRQRYGSVG